MKSLDKVEGIWNKLEASYEASLAKNPDATRLVYLKRLVMFSGSESDIIKIKSLFSKEISTYDSDEIVRYDTLIEKIAKVHASIIGIEEDSIDDLDKFVAAVISENPKVKYVLEINSFDVRHYDMFKETNKMFPEDALKFGVVEDTVLELEDGIAIIAIDNETDLYKSFRNDNEIVTFMKTVSNSIDSGEVSDFYLSVYSYLFNCFSNKINIGRKFFIDSTMWNNAKNSSEHLGELLNIEEAKIFGASSLTGAVIDREFSYKEADYTNNLSYAKVVLI